MNLTLSPPPATGGSAEADIAALSEWCRRLHNQLRRVLISLDGTNITSVPYEIITGIPVPEEAEQ